MDLGLAGKHCFVTGASAGIGRATALALAAEGAVLSIAGRDEAALSATRDLIIAKGASVLGIIACDLSRPTGIDAAAAAVAQAKRPIEVLVNNAGGGRPYNLDTPLETEAWDEAFDLNFRGPPSRRSRVAPHATRAMGADHHDHRLACTQTDERRDACQGSDR